MSSNPRIYPPSQNIPPFSTNLYVRPSQNLPSAPSQNILPFSTNLYVRLSQNLPLPPRIYPPFKKMYICDPPRIYLSVPEHTPHPFSQNLPLPEYTTLFNKCICATLSESPPSQNIPLFNNYVRPSENLPLPPRIYPSLFNNYNIMRPFQNRPLPPRIYPSIFNNYNIMRPSQNLPIPPRIYPPPLFNKCICVTLLESTPPSQNTPPFSTTICDRPRIYPSLPEYTPLSTNVYVRPPKNIPLPP